jgi:hypothetical protein
MKFSNSDNKYNTFATGQRNCLLSNMYRGLFYYSVLPLLFMKRGLNPDTGGQITMHMLQLAMVLVFKKCIYLWGYSC